MCFVDKLILSDFWHLAFHSHILLRDAGAVYASGGSTLGRGAQDPPIRG